MTLRRLDVMQKKEVVKNSFRSRAFPASTQSQSARAGLSAATINPRPTSVSAAIHNANFLNRDLFD
jgi:hypothetical protein